VLVFRLSSSSDSSTPQISYPWEALWSVQVVLKGEWLDIQYGTYGSSVTYAYDPSNSSYSLLSGVSLLNVSAGLSSVLSVHSSSRECSVVSIVSSGSGPGSYLGTNWVVVDGGDHSTVYGLGDWSVSGSSSVCLDDGHYRSNQRVSR
jgi:hypothetical protein